MKTRVGLFCLLLLVLLFTFQTFYIPVLSQGYFTANDPSFMWFSATKSLPQMFFSPEHYRVLPPFFFQPMLGPTFKIDWLMFRFEPTGYYVHNLISVLLTALALFLLAKRYVSGLGAFTACSLFIASPVTIGIYSHLTNRHYLEGLFFALLSAYFHLAHANRLGMAMSLLCYLTAALYKEVYVVLPFVLAPLAPWTSPENRKRMAAFGFVALLYLAWRFFMIRGVGGYPNVNAFAAQTYWTSLKNLTGHFPAFLFGQNKGAFWLLASALFLCAARRKAFYAFFVPSLFFIVLPIGAVGSLVDGHFTFGRFFLGLSTFLILTATILCGRMAEEGAARKFVSSAAAALTLFFFTYENFELKPVILHSLNAAHSSAARFIASKQPYLFADEVPWYYLRLRDLYGRFSDREPNARILPKDGFPLAFIADEAVKKDIEKTTGVSIPTIRLAGGTVHGQIRIDGYRFSWDIQGPRERCGLLEGDDGIYNYAVYPWPPSGRFYMGQRYPDDRKEAFWVRFYCKTDDGGYVATPGLSIEIPDNKTHVF